MSSQTIQIQLPELKHYHGTALTIIYIHPFTVTETFFHYIKPQFGCINPEIIAKVNLSLEQILEDEVAGMAFPIDARFFDNYPLVFGKEDDVAGRQHPREH